MIAAKIKEGVHYAVNSEPRKGVDEDRLSHLSAFRVVVKEKGCQRWAETAKDAYGNNGGGYRMDGIRALRVVDATGAEDSEHFGENVWKARDFLMPWEQYQSERDERTRKEHEKLLAEQELRREWEAKRVNMRERLKEFGLLAGYDYSRPVEPDAPYRDFVEYDQQGSDKIMYGFSQTGLEKLLSSISDKVYEIVSAME